MQEIKKIKIGQKFKTERTERVAQISGEMVDIPEGTNGYVAGNGYIIVTEGKHTGQWIPIDRKRYEVSGIDYEGIAHHVSSGLISDGYNLDEKAEIYIADYLRAIALR